jgi:hypothetical protein
MNTTTEIRKLADKLDAMVPALREAWARTARVDDSNDTYEIASRLVVEQCMTADTVSAEISEPMIGDGNEVYTDTSPNLGEFGPAGDESAYATVSGPEISFAQAPARFATREEWLRAAIEVFRPWFSLINEPLPAKIRISCGWGASGARAENSVILGVTLRRDLSADEVSEIFISPEDADAVSMLETVLHELIHVRDNIASGHRGEFIRLAKAFGFTKPWTETPPSSELRPILQAIAWDLGAYPGARVVIPSRRSLTLAPFASGGPIKITSAGGGQTNRHILCTCPIDGYQVRTTKKWIEVGLPMCPAGHTMHVA